MVTHTTTVKVRWSDVDPAAIVFYPRFFEWFDLGTEALFDSVGLPWPKMFPDHGLAGVPIVEAGATFTASVRYGDTASIRSTVVWVKDKTFRMEHEVSVGGAPCARGFEVRAWVGRPATPGARPRAKPIPEDIVARLRAPTGDPSR